MIKHIAIVFVILLFVIESKAEEFSFTPLRINFKGIIAQDSTFEFSKAAQ
jgi:hypothetical protein